METSDIDGERAKPTAKVEPAKAYESYANHNSLWR